MIVIYIWDMYSGISKWKIKCMSTCIYIYSTPVKINNIIIPDLTHFSFTSLFLKCGQSAVASHDLYKAGVWDRL